MKPLATVVGLLSLFGACAPSSLMAAPTYSSSEAVTSPANGANYPIPPSVGYVFVPIKTTNQWVQFTGAPPSTYISVSWGMSVTLSWSPNPWVLADDYANNQLVLADGAGYWRRNAYNNSGNFSTSAAFQQQQIGGYSVTALSGVGDSTTHVTVYFVVSKPT